MVGTLAAGGGGLSLTLPPGTYGTGWQLGGALASGPFVPPISIAGQTLPPGTNAVQDSGGAWQPVEDAGSLTPDDFKFVIRGTLGTSAAVGGPAPALARAVIRPNPVGV